MVRWRRLGAAAAALLAGCYRPPPAPIGTEAGPLPGVVDDARPAETAAPLGCEEAVAHVLATHPALRAAEAGLPVRRAELEAAIGPPDLELRARDDARAFGDDTRVGLRWRPDVPGVDGAREAAARARVRLSEAEVALLRADLAARVREAYAELALARRLQSIRAREAEIAAERRRVVRQLTAAGMATAVAVQEEAVDALRTEARAAAAAEAERAARAAVQALTGRPPVDGDLACAPAPEPPTDLEAHPAVRAAREAALAADAEAFAARRAGWPWPSFLEVSWDREPDEEDDRLLLQAGVRLPLPDGEAAIADAERARLAAGIDAARAQVAAAVREARAAHAAARATLARLEAGRETVAAAAALAERAARAGAEPREVLRLRTRLLAYDADLAEARHRVAITATALRRALGRP